MWGSGGTSEVSTWVGAPAPIAEAQHELLATDAHGEQRGRLRGSGQMGWVRPGQGAHRREPKGTEKLIPSRATTSP